jgi:hypothetical protein
MQRFRKKPVVVEAVRWTGDNEAEVTAFAGPGFGTVEVVDRVMDPDITAEVYEAVAE